MGSIYDFGAATPFLEICFILLNQNDLIRQTEALIFENNERKAKVCSCQKH